MAELRTPRVDLELLVRFGDSPPVPLGTATVDFPLQVVRGDRPGEFKITQDDIRAGLRQLLLDVVESLDEGAEVGGDGGA